MGNGSAHSLIGTSVLPSALQGERLGSCKRQMPISDRLLVFSFTELRTDENYVDGEIGTTCEPYRPPGWPP